MKLRTLILSAAVIMSAGPILAQTTPAQLAALPLEEFASLSDDQILAALNDPSARATISSNLARVQSIPAQRDAALQNASIRRLIAIESGVCGQRNVAGTNVVNGNIQAVCGGEPVAFAAPLAGLGLFGLLLAASGDGTDGTVTSTSTTSSTGG
jgi:hypothetical protein